MENNNQVIPRSTSYPFNTPYIPPAEQERIDKMNKKHAVVSIILPAYNAHNTIKRTLASIAMQENIDEIETIIADDCSDMTYDHIAKEFAHMMKIKIVRLLKNGGPGAARQVGYDHSEGDIVMWMDADDTLVSADTVTTLKNVLIQKDMDCVYGKFLEQNEDGSIYPHEQHMVWMFGKAYARKFLDKWNIRFTVSLSNEDTAFNSIVRGVTDRIWYIPKDVYIWHFKANSITRIREGMYGQDSGYKGYIDAMVTQILELMKRNVNKNYILGEIMGVFCTLYHFHVENMQRYPMNTEISLNWIRGFYELVYKPNEKYITETMLMQSFAQCAANQNIAAKGIIPEITFREFIEQVKSKPMEQNDMHEVGGATPAGYIAPEVSKDWPVEIHEYYDEVEKPYEVNSDTNESRYGGMKKVLGIEEDEDSYDKYYDGSKEKEIARQQKLKVRKDNSVLTEPIKPFMVPENPLANDNGIEYLDMQLTCTTSNNSQEIPKFSEKFHFDKCNTSCEANCDSCIGCSDTIE